MVNTSKIKMTVITIVILVACVVSCVTAGCATGHADANKKNVSVKPTKQEEDQKEEILTQPAPTRPVAKSHLVPRGNLVNTVGGRFAAPMRSVRTDAGDLLALLESATIRKGREVPTSRIKAVMYFDVLFESGRHYILDIRFGDGDTMQLANYYSYGTPADPDDPNEYPQDLGTITNGKIAKRLRDAIVFAGVNRNDLRSIKTVTVSNRDNLETATLNAQQREDFQRLIFFSDLESTHPTSYLAYDYVFDIGLADGSSRTVTLNTAGRFGLGNAVYLLDPSYPTSRSDLMAFISSLGISDHDLGDNSPLSQYRM
jgi:hypothetical protein